MFNLRMKTVTAAVLYTAFALTVTACRSKSSHTSVYIHERKPAEPTARESHQVVDDGEYHMVSPGQMVVEP